MNGIYLGMNTAIINLSNEYFKTPEALASSDSFKEFLDRYLKDLAVRDIKLYKKVTCGKDSQEVVTNLIIIAKQLLVFEVEEINNPFLELLGRSEALKLVEDCYNYWRSKQRFSIINGNMGNLADSFINSDTKFTELVLQLYRTCEEKLQGKTNAVYRQLQAGTQASCVIKSYKWETPNSYNILKNVQFISQVMLRTPIIFHTGCNKRTGIFQPLEENPIKSFRLNQNEWYCIPLKINDLLAFTYFHRDYMGNGLANSNLFELAREEECVNKKPDIIVLYGNQEEQVRQGFFHDQENDIWIGTLTYDNKIEYFGYMKKILLTLYNLKNMTRNYLPIHGSMSNIYFKDGSMKSIVFVGDSGAGKSETIQCLKEIAGNDIAKMDVIFDDMGALMIEDDKVYASGSETGGFVRLDDLSNATAYQDLERSVFLNPDIPNARVILPLSSYELVSSKHPVDMILYANNYEEKVGVEQFSDIERAKEVFLKGQRRALGTTGEVGLTSTFFANPFGPMQKQEICLKIFDEVFNKLKENNTYVGQIFTNLGTDHKENIVESTKELLEFLK